MALTQISTAGVKDDAVTAGKIPADAIGSSEIAANAVGSSELADNAVDTAAIADDAVNMNKLSNLDNGRIIARVSSGAGNPEAATAAQVRNVLNVADGATQTTINNNADNRLITGSGTANTLEGEANLTFDGTQLNVTPTLFGSGNVSKTQDGVIIQRNSSSGTAEIVAGRSGGNYGGIEHYVAGASGVTKRHQIDYQSNFSWYGADGTTQRMKLDSTGNVGIGNISPAAKLHLDTNHYVVTSSGQATTGIHLDGTHGNAGEYGGGISFGCGGNGSAAIAARQATSSQHVVGMSFFTHDSSSSTANAVEKVRIHDGGVTSFNDGVCLGNGVTLSSSNTLDDYEEGTWTPVYVGGSGSIGSITYSIQGGFYRKIGNVVYIEGVLRGQVTNNSTGTYDLSGLPFTVNSSSNGAIFVCFNQNGWNRAPHYFTTMGGTTSARAREGISVGASAYTNAASDGFSASSTSSNRTYFSGCYIT